ncbi:MAG: tetratricopeptide repeat-containing sulfotransferase family protein [Steroidobacteraceae bacterium]
MTRSDAVDLEIMRASLLLDSDPAAAARRASDILAASPGHAEANLLYAAARRKLGDPAAAALEALADADRDTPLMQLELGRSYAASGRGGEALVAFRRAVTLDESLADAWRELAAMFFATGETRAGDAAYARYSRLAPDPPELSDAIIAVADNRLAVAEALLRQRLDQAPHDVVALRMLADTATRAGNYLEAERRLTECLKLAPGFAAARFDLARLLYTQHRNSEVLLEVERLLASEPRDIDYLSLKAQALRLTGRNEEAIALMEQAVADHPGEDRAWLLCGHLIREVGEQARAIEMYRQALAVRPQSGRAYESLANLKTFCFTREDLAAMQELAQSGIRGADRIHVEFALGKALEDEGQFALSFEHYARGNALHRATIGHDADAMTTDVQRSKRLYSARFFADRSGWGTGRPDPIFIVGLPRSGSTLLEQILASHSQVEGTGELADIPAIALELTAGQNSAGRSEYLESVAMLGCQNVESLADKYLSRTKAYRPLGRPRFVDKLLGNFGNIAFIHLMFPHAAIIDARRHPLGCGFSCYKQLFSRELAFTYDLAEMGRYYRDYADLMEHFDAVLPKRVHRVYYEQLVADPEREVRRLLDYCDLPFEQQCMHFYENRRVVQTISSEQVRRPIYADAVDHWRNYEQWLGPLKNALGELVERYPIKIISPEPQARKLSLGGLGSNFNAAPSPGAG